MNHRRSSRVLAVLASVSIITLGSIGHAAPQSEAPEQEWDVNAPPGYTETRRFTVTEGTWMSVDVSPDGQVIVFDLLGDVYTLPIAGGKATRVLGGVAWDMQPRFSPSGEWLAFTSDRAGGDNIWIARPDGSEPQQISEEPFRLLNSPNWSPDGEYIVARKHFTSGRSLGAGEMWLYHRSGGSGVQLTARENEQKDAGEPIFSPDGRYVYFSQDTTPGSTFQYNKDPNPGIYTTRRLDLDEGEIVNVIGGAGGAVRPTPSPDGSTIAFVRRVRLQSVLYLRDVESGRERPLYEGLDHDMQETWAIHGVYPAFAWTPDGGSIVVWAGGQIQRVDAQSGAVTTIPFEADVEFQVADAVRYPQDVSPAQFKARMLRWVSVSPDGTRVLYSAAGRVFVLDLDGGDATTVSGSEELAYYPAWHPDSRHFVYVAWDDQALASIRIGDTEGAPTHDLATGKGHFVDPVFTPDGDHVVYRKARGGNLGQPAVVR